jgi:hypothetical protein
MYVKRVKRTQGMLESDQSRELDGRVFLRSSGGADPRTSVATTGVTMLRAAVALRSCGHAAAAAAAGGQARPRVVVVTGGAKGIGKGTQCMLASYITCPSTPPSSLHHPPQGLCGVIHSVAKSQFGHAVHQLPSVNLWPSVG